MKQLTKQQWMYQYKDDIEKVVLANTSTFIHKDDIEASMIIASIVNKEWEKFKEKHNIQEQQSDSKLNVGNEEIEIPTFGNK